MPSSSVQRQGAALFGISAVSALVTSVPAAVRVADRDVGFLPAWFALAGTLVVPAFVAVLVVREAPSGARALAGANALLSAAASALFLSLSAVALGLFGAVLRRTTHHHGLAGATFALAGAAVVAFIGLVLFRSVGYARRWPPALRRGVSVAGIVTALAVAGIAGGLGLLRSDLGPFAVDTFLDILAFLLATGLSSSRTLTVRLAARPVVFAAPALPLFLLVIAMGFARVLAERVIQNAPFYSLFPPFF